jgi:hypothetical protein
VRRGLAERRNYQANSGHEVATNVLTARRAATIAMGNSLVLMDSTVIA